MAAPTPLTKPLARYSHVRQVGDVVFVAGQGARDPATEKYRGVTLDADGKVLAYDIAEQTLGVLTNIERALASVGLSRADLVDLNVFLRDMNDFPSMNKVWNEFFAAVEPPPTRTTVEVSKLPGLNWVEMKAVAQAKTAGKPR